MSDDRIHRVVSADGTEIAGRVHGQGPPLVFLHGALGDGDSAWGPLVPHLRDRFTCFLPSYRGRGLSGTSGDMSPERLIEDVAAFVDSLGEPVGLLCWSGGAPWGLLGASTTETVAAIAAYDPLFTTALPEEDLASFFEQLLLPVIEAAGDGRLVDACRAFMAGVHPADEMAAMEERGLIESFARDVPNFIQMIEHTGSELSWAVPAMLASVSVPVLVLHGSRSPSMFGTSVSYLLEHVERAEARELPGLAHGAPASEPERVATEVAAFFDTSLPRQPG